MSEAETWYEQVRDDRLLMQGDLIYDCPYPIPPKDVKNVKAGDKISVDLKKYDVIILSQSCDLEWKKIEYVLVCPFWPLKDLEEVFPHLKDPNLKESIKRGYQPPYVMLDKHEPEDDFLLVDFRYVYSIPIEILDYLIESNPTRWRLNPPYREHLSQEFAKFFMRVGLPRSIPQFSKFDIDYCDTCPIHHSVRE